MNSSNVDQFIGQLTKCSLLDAEKLRRASKIVRLKPDLKEGVTQLIADGYLTRWQARQLLEDGPKRFFVGQYLLLKELGRGGMGTVYRAMHPAMSRVVALKVMSNDFLTDRKKVARFEREIRTAAALDHPNIARALDAGHDGDTHYLVMEHVHGKDIDHWIEAIKVLPIAWCCQCISQAAAGLQHAFERGVTHRDLKPSNLLVVGKSLDREPVVKIVDFGLARMSDDVGGEEQLTRAGRTVGTWAYIAPEQAMDATHADIRSDIYSLGCTLYHMLSGRLPFQGKTELETLMMRMKSDPPRLKSVRSDVDSRLDDIVAKMVSRDPSQRFQTPAELAQALTAYAALPVPFRIHAEYPNDLLHAEFNSESLNSSLRNTDPEFDRFLMTIPDLPIQKSSVTKCVSNKPEKRIANWKVQLAGLAVSVIVLAIVFWLLTR